MSDGEVSETTSVVSEGVKARGRSWLDQLRIEATEALMDDVRPFSPDWDPADMHEDIRETLLPFFDKLNGLADRQERFRVALQDVQGVARNGPGTGVDTPETRLDRIDDIVRETLAPMTKRRT